VAVKRSAQDAPVDTAVPDATDRKQEPAKAATAAEASGDVLQGTYRFDHYLQPDGNRVSVSAQLEKDMSVLWARYMLVFEDQTFSAHSQLLGKDDDYGYEGCEAEFTMGVVLTNSTLEIPTGVNARGKVTLLQIKEREISGGHKTSHKSTGFDCGVSFEKGKMTYERQPDGSVRMIDPLGGTMVLVPDTLDPDWKTRLPSGG
jgi:hypothetical protein